MHILTDHMAALGRSLTCQRSLRRQKQRLHLLLLKPEWLPDPQRQDNLSTAQEMLLLTRATQRLGGTVSISIFQDVKRGPPSVSRLRGLKKSEKRGVRRGAPRTATGPTCNCDPRSSLKKRIEVHE